MRNLGIPGLCQKYRAQAYQITSMNLDKFNRENTLKAVRVYQIKSWCHESDEDEFVTAILGTGYKVMRKDNIPKFIFIESLPRELSRQRDESSEDIKIPTNLMDPATVKTRIKQQIAKLEEDLKVIEKWEKIQLRLQK